MSYYTKHHKKFRQYYLDNREYKIEQSRLYNIIHKNRLKKRVECPCGGFYQICNKSIHNKSYKHEQYIKLLNHTTNL